MKATKISIEKAKVDKLFYFVANAVIYRDSDKKCLILKRSDREITHPGRYGVIGGKLEWQDMSVDNPDHINGDVLDYNDMIEKLLKREAMEEAGVEIYPEIRYINSKTFIRPDEVPVVLVKFTAKYKSGDIKLEEGAFTDFAWVNAEEIGQYECIDGIQEEVKQSIIAWN
jgi:8-oxo-dGTP pyrophosphatase MutT (NUDIX family)